MSKHLSYFMRLDCAGDVLNSADPMRKPLRRVTEAVAVTKKLRPAALENPGEIKVLQITDGNGFETMLASHVLKLKEAKVITTHKPKHGLQTRVQNFTLLVSKNPFNEIKDLEAIDVDTILVFTGNIDYNKAVDLYNESDACGVIIMPNPDSIRYKSRYFGMDQLVDLQAAKLLALRDHLGGKPNLTVDQEVLSRNNVIISNSHVY